MNVRFISDFHFNHENMAKKRGFSSSEEMNWHIVKSFNDVVRSSKDITYILGDITMEKLDGIEWLGLLRGVKHVIGGNHDKRGAALEILKYANTYSGCYKYKDTILTHIPVHPVELSYNILYNIHGHVHENTLDDHRYINVCCEVIDYKPKTYEELKQIYLNE